MQTVGGRYVMDGHIGEGGMGQVYRVRHLSLGKPFALKVISPAFANDTAARERFNHEAKLASEIKHANIVSIVDFGEDPALGAYMVMELVDGEPLLDGAGTPMPVRRAIEVLSQVADALDHLHRRGILHGDIKAENIMLQTETDGTHGARKQRVVRLLDFGLAHTLGDETEGLSGSPAYVAPERVRGEPASVLTDVYALGVLGYLLFTQTLPFAGEMMEVLHAHLEQRAPSMSSRRGELLDDSLEGLIARAMAKNPADRHPSAAAFRYELNTVMDMLDLGRRATKARQSQPTIEHNPHIAMLVALFNDSPYSQAIVAADGTIKVANGAFSRMVGDSTVTNLAQTTLSRDLPGILTAMQEASADSWPTECRARISSSMELVIWVAPAPAMPGFLHLLARIADQ